VLVAMFKFKEIVSGILHTKKFSVLESDNKGKSSQDKLQEIAINDAFLPFLYCLV
jgi:hypothetical protein